MKLSLKAKLILLCFGTAIVALLGLGLYLKGRQVGIATTEMVDVTKELSQLEGEKLEIRKNVHALDRDALRTRILELSERTTREVRASHP